MSVTQSVARELSHAELESLLGVFVLDAVDDHERDAVERHLAICPRCRQEVTDARRAVALLAPPGESAPTTVWRAIEAEIDAPPPAPSLLTLLDTRRPRRRLVQAAAAAAVVLIVMLGWRSQEQRQRLDRLTAAVEADGLRGIALAAEANPMARRAELRATDGRVLGRAVVRPDGTGFLVDHSLEPLAEGQTYQLWAVVDGQRISAGALGARPGVAPFRVEAGTWALAVTRERSPGVATSDAPPVAAGRLRV